MLLYDLGAGKPVMLPGNLKVNHGPVAPFEPRRRQPRSGPAG